MNVVGRWNLFSIKRVPLLCRFCRVLTFLDDWPIERFDYHRVARWVFGAQVSAVPWRHCWESRFYQSRPHLESRRWRVRRARLPNKIEWLVLVVLVVPVLVGWRDDWVYKARYFDAVHLAKWGLLFIHFNKKSPSRCRNNIAWGSGANRQKLVGIHAALNRDWRRRGGWDRPQFYALILPVLRSLWQVPRIQFV